MSNPLKWVTMDMSGAGVSLLATMAISYFLCGLDTQVGSDFCQSGLVRLFRSWLFCFLVGFGGKPQVELLRHFGSTKTLNLAVRINLGAHEPRVISVILWLIQVVSVAGGQFVEDL